MAGKRKLGDMLIEAGLVSEFELNTALSDQKQWGRPLGVTLVRLGFVAEAEVARVLSEQLDLPVVDLGGKVVAPEMIELVPHETASKHRCLPLAVHQAGSITELYLGMSDPTDLAVIDDIAFRTGHKIRPVLVGGQQLEAAIDRSYRPVDLHDRSVQITAADIGKAGTATRAPRRPTARKQPKQSKQPKPQKQISLPAPDDAELVLTEDADEPDAWFSDGMQALADMISARSPESNGNVLMALVQVMIAKGMIDPDDLLIAIESIAADRK